MFIIHFLSGTIEGFPERDWEDEPSLSSPIWNGHESLLSRDKLPRPGLLWSKTLSSILTLGFFFSVIFCCNLPIPFKKCLSFFIYSSSKMSSESEFSCCSPISPSWPPSAFSASPVIWSWLYLYPSFWSVVTTRLLDFWYTLPALYFFWGADFSLI